MTLKFLKCKSIDNVLSVNQSRLLLGEGKNIFMHHKVDGD